MTEEVSEQIRADERKAGRSEGFRDRGILEILRKQFIDAPLQLESRLASASALGKTPKQIAVESAMGYRDLYAKFNELIERYEERNPNITKTIIKPVEDSRATLNAKLAQYGVEI